jgi:hypothetical protein
LQKKVVLYFLAQVLFINSNLCDCRYELVYACGSQSLLPNLDQRVVAAQALLHAISDMADTGKSMLGVHGVAVWNKPGDPSRYNNTLHD